MKDNNSAGWLPVLVVLPLLTWGQPARAHQDPVGDVHPQVYVKNGHFVVEFRNNEKQSIHLSPLGFRMVFGRDGKVVLPRHEHKISEERFKMAWYGETRRNEGGVVYEIDAAASNLTVKRDRGEDFSIALPWEKGEMPLECFHDWQVVGDTLAILGTLPHPDGPYRGANLVVAIFAVSQPHSARIIELGNVDTIYHFPTSSNLIQCGNRVAVAWMGSPADGDKLPRFNLTAIDPQNETFTTQALEAEHYWNTHISMAAMGEHLCIAWHGGQIYGGYRPARIQTLFVDIPKE